MAEPRKKKPRSEKNNRRPTPAKRASRASRNDKKKSDAKVAKPRVRRESPEKIAARNAEIVQLREQYLLTWEQIGARLGIDESTARRGYDSFTESRVYNESLKQALSEMREYAGALHLNSAELVVIARNLKALDAGKDVPEPDYDPRVRIAAVHEMSDLIFRIITIKRAIGDLPQNFNEMVADRDFEAILDGILDLLVEYDLPREAFVQISEIIAGRVNVSVPKTHLEAVAQE